MSIKHIYEHLLEHFICLKSFIITVKFSCYALWAKSWSSFSLNSHWLQQQADLIACGFPYQFNAALKKMGPLVSTMLDRKSQHLAALNISQTQPSNAIRTNKQTPRSQVCNLHTALQNPTHSEVGSTRYAGISPTNGLVGCTTTNHSLSDHSLMLLSPKFGCIKAIKGHNPTTSPLVTSSETSRQSLHSSTTPDRLEQTMQSQKLQVMNKSPRKMLQRKPCQKVWLFWRHSLQLFFLWQSFTILLEMFGPPLWDWTWL